MLLLRSLFFLVLMPGSITVLIPYWLVSSGHALRSAGNKALEYCGVPLIAAGAVLLLGCIWRFYSEGRGTLAPVDPPKRLVVHGVYRYIRNPMYTAVLSILLGEALFFWSGAILIEAALFFVITNLFVRFYEEPTLRRKFGESYNDYLKTAGRWVPRPTRRNN